MSQRISGTQSFSRTANLPDDVAFTLCGWARLAVDRNDFSCLASIESATATATQFIQLATAADGTTLTLFNEAGASGVTQALTVDTDFFWAISSSSLSSSTAYYRAAGANALTSFTNTTARAAFTPGVIYVGTDSYSEPFNGRVWNVKCWGRVLTAAELLVESYFSRCMFPASVNFHWPLKNVADTRDISGNGRTPTVTGTPTTEDELGLFAPRRRIFLPAAAAGGSTPNVGRLSLLGVGI